MTWYKRCQSQPRTRSYGIEPSMVRFTVIPRVDGEAKTRHYTQKIRKSQVNSQVAETFDGQRRRLSTEERRERSQRQTSLKERRSGKKATSLGNESPSGHGGSESDLRRNDQKNGTRTSGSRLFRRLSSARSLPVGLSINNELTPAEGVRIECRRRKKIILEASRSGPPRRAEASRSGPSGERQGGSAGVSRDTVIMSL
ncbi:hypothetical protein C8R45DRAFT_928728 [Mycena sanguinolenta]|nr:hypothetical protein C8R45DRAFT_928728 [Mycena sanguinolenta]